MDTFLGGSLQKYQIFISSQKGVGYPLNLIVFVCVQVIRIYIDALAWIFSSTIYIIMYYKQIYD